MCRDILVAPKKSCLQGLYRIVSRDWTGPLMGLLNRTDVKNISALHLFLISIELLKMVPVRVRLSSEFLSGVGFSTKQCVLA
jgi:hypothetical protein